MMGGWDSMLGGFGGLWMLVPLLFWGGILVLIAWAITRIFPGQRNTGDRESGGGSAEDILRGRFARGEIDAQEYERSLEILRGERWQRGKELNPR